MVLDGLSPRSRSTDPVTSVDAGRAADLKGSQAAVLEHMRVTAWAFPDYTQPELVRDFPQWSPSRVRSAVSELVDKGLVEPVEGMFRPTRYGNPAQVYRAVVPPG